MKIMKKVLLDTDPGSDIDDSFCLAYLLARPDCELCGITTVTADPQLRAGIADAICKAADRQIPIHAGASWPLTATPLQTEVPQYPYLSGYPHDTEFPADAVDFLYRTIREHPNEITLLAVGPLTNIALLFSIYPETAGLLQELVVMGGSFLAPEPFGEWNLRCDPHAAKIVFSANVPKIRLVGLDVTALCRKRREEVVTRCGCPTLELVATLSEAWFLRDEYTYFNDPLAAAVIFEDSLCTFRRGYARVLTEDPRGAVLWREDPEGPHLIADTVDTEAFWEHYFSIVK